MTATFSGASHRSYSQLDLYSSCGERYRLERVLRVPEVPSVWRVGGTAFHEVTEAFDRLAFADGVDESAAAPGWHEDWDITFDQLVQEQVDTTGVPVEQWRRAGRLTKDKPNKEDFAWWRMAGRNMVQDYINWRVETQHRLVVLELPDGQPAIEVDMMSVLGGVSVKMFPDVVMVDTGTGQAIVVDKKTGSREPKKTHQLGTYAAGLEEAFGISANWGAYFMARKGTLSDPKPIGHFTPALMGSMYAAFDRAEKAGIYIPHIDEHCGYCGVAAHCKYTTGSTPFGGDEWT